MSMKNQKFKQFDSIDRINIENYLNLNLKLKEIAKRMNRADGTGISKEIELRRQEIKSQASFFTNNYCKKKAKCTLTNVCDANCHTECRKCKKCNEECSEFEKDICERLTRFPHVCNGCEKLTHCKRIKFKYSATHAQKEYENTLKVSRQGAKPEIIDVLNKEVVPLLLKGQSVKLVYNNHKDEIPCSVNTIYNYIDMRSIEN